MGEGGEGSKNGVKGDRLSLSARKGLRASSKMSMSTPASEEAKGRRITRLASSSAPTDTIAESFGERPVLRAAEEEMRSSPSARLSSGMAMHATLRCFLPLTIT